MPSNTVVPTPGVRPAPALNQDLITSARAGDERAIEALGTHALAIARMAARKVRAGAAAYDIDDLTQEGAIAVVQQLLTRNPELDAIADIGGFSYTVARRAVLRALAQVDAPEGDEAALASLTVDSPEDAILSRIDAERMPAKARAAFSEGRMATLAGVFGPMSVMVVR